MHVLCGPVQEIPGRLSFIYELDQTFFLKRGLNPRLPLPQAPKVKHYPAACVAACVVTHTEIGPWHIVIQ